MLPSLRCVAVKTGACRLFCGLCDLAGLQRAVVFELEQPEGVIPSDLSSVRLADGCAVEPLRGVIDILEGPIRREQDSICADLKQGIDERLGAEVSRRRQIEMLVEVFADLLL